MKFWRRSKRNKYRRRKEAMSPRVVVIRQIVVGVLLVLLITVLGIGVWYGSRIERLTISHVEVVGGETIDRDRLHEIADAKLDGAYYRVVPRRFAWTYPETEILDEIAAIDRVKNVAVERTSGTELTIIFEEYTPFALWCESPTSTDCLFLDREGYAFAVAPRLQGGAFVRFSEIGRVPEKGVQAFPGEYVREREAFMTDAYDELQLPIVQVEKTTDDELTYFIAGGGQLKVSTRMSGEDTLKNLTTILTSSEFSHLKPGNFQYIDLRYGNKIFVNEELSPVESIEATVASSTAS